jgi:anaerobic magnesium-protoporphyrin IX monomethyl ester cyclase
MITMNHHVTTIAQALREEVELLVAGGPLPTIEPGMYLDLFDVVVLGEGETTFLEIVQHHLHQTSWEETKGIAFRKKDKQIQRTAPRPHNSDLDSIPFPARDLFPNAKYQWYWRTFHKYTVSSMISTRGCPYICDFCSSPVFGQSYRERSPQNVVQEMANIHNMGYDRIFFSDDSFTQNSKRVADICHLLIENHPEIQWMCLSRADRLSPKIANLMAQAGCRQIFFGIESGNQQILQTMGKHITPALAKKAVESAHQAGIQTGGFFILGYPGETNLTLLDTLRFSSNLPLDYLSYSFPYPIYGTGLYQRVQHQITNPEWRKQRGSATKHDLLFKGPFSQTKLRFAMVKGMVQHRLRKNGPVGQASAHVFESITDRIITFLR